MGFFKFLKKDKKEENVITYSLPVVIKTENINNTLLKISKENNIPLSTLDFKLLSFKTYIKTENDSEFIEIDEHSRFLLEDENFLRNENNEIKQVYEIKVIKYQINDFELIGEIKINKNFTSADFVISPKSLIIDNRFLFENFRNELNKKKLKNGLLIELFDKEMEKSLEKVIAKIQVLGSLEEEESVVLCRGLDKIPTVQGEIIYHYKQNEKSIKKELIYPVKENEILIEIKKPKKGKNGRNCKGKIIPVDEVKDFEIPNISFDKKTIKKEEDDEKRVFIALKGGYLYNDSGTYVIKDKMEIKQINIKTGNVRGGEESNVKIDVKEKDALKEAIGDNTVVETTHLIVRGNVGNSALIKCKELEIMGQTHKKSKIYTKKGEINIHKGYVEGNEIKINRLENGIVKADKVIISQAVGGEIYAKKVEIEILGSHLKCYALEEIKISDLKGSENRLIISPPKILGEEVDIEKLQHKIEEARKNLQIKLKEYNKRIKIINENRISIDELKQIYLQNKAKNLKTPHSVLKKLKEFNIFRQKTLELKEEIQFLKEEIKELNETVDRYQNIVAVAKIVSLTPWKPYNRIEFDLIEPPVKLTYDTKGNEGICGFKLKDYGEETYKIVKIKIKEKDDSGT